MRAQRFLAYQLTCWALLASLAYGTLPPFALAGSLGVLLVATYTLSPLLAFFAGGIGWRRYPTARFRLFVVRPALYAQLILPVVTVGALAGLVAGAVIGSPAAGGRAGAIGALLLASLILVAGWLGTRRLVVREVEASVPGLPHAFDGMRIAQVSDTHMGPQTSVAFMAKVTRVLLRLDADVVTVTGDMVDDRAEDVAVFAEWISTITRADSKRDGPRVFLIPGNHDIYAGWNAVAQGLRRETVAHVLVNEAQLLERDGERLAIVGLGDPAGGYIAAQASAAPDIDRALASVPLGIPVIAFAHNPALWPALAARGVALTLSGHTHWGQLALPMRGWSLASVFLEHAMGAFQQGDALLYIHPGTGFWGIPFRIGAFPEIAQVTLRRANEPAIAMGAARRAENIRCRWWWMPVRTAT